MEQILNGRYRVGPKIGAGGMAVVYRGYDALLGRGVAIKVLRDQYAADPAFLARFEREAQAVAALTHPNIINIFDVGVDGGTHYFVMELVDGPNLKEVIQAHGPLPPDDAVGIMLQVLAGLGYAHARGLVHRDVKPQNILLPPDGTAKVTDFGIAKALSDATLTEAGIGLGTVHYISPEQARGEPATPASDLYSAGVTLYEALTGRLPFTADSAVGVAVRHVHDPPPPPARINPRLPAQLSSLTLHALEKDPAARFASAKEMAAALRNWRAWPVGSATRARGRAARVVPAPTRVGPVPAAATVAVPGGHTGRVARGVPAPPPPAPRARRAASGCVTWLVGLLVLAGLVGVLLAGYRLSPLGAMATTPTEPPVLAGLPPTVEPSPTLVPTPTEEPTVAPSPTPAARVATPATPVRPTATATSIPVPPTLPATATLPAPTAPPAPTATPTVALVTVPNFVGQTLGQSQEAAEAVGLTVEQVEARNSNTVRAGQVMLQNPEAGTPVSPGRTITVVVSRGPVLARVPNVAGQPYERAAAQLDGLGFDVARTNAPSRTAPQGTVIEQTPAAGTEAAGGTTVRLTVSAGDLVTVPDVFGMSYETAQSTLRAAGFTVNSVNPMTRAQIEAQNARFFQVYPNARDGQVISQTLPAGQQYERGTAIGIAYYRAR